MQASSNTVHNGEVIEGINKSDVFIPTSDMPPPIHNSAVTHALLSRRSAYPTNHVLDVKDQCRSVAMVQSSSPILISQSERSNIPFAVAIGVDTTSSAMESVASSTSSKSIDNNQKKEPIGRTFLDV